MISDNDLAWAGGFFDGEGCVGVYRQGASKGYALQVSVTQMNRSVLESFKNIVGAGNICRVRRGNGSWVWASTGSRAADVLAIIYPFLKTNKREQAALGLEHQAEVSFGANRLSDEQIEKRRERAQQIKNLKRVLS